MTIFNPDLVNAQPAGNAFMQQNAPPTQAGVIIDPAQVPKILQPGSFPDLPADTGGLFSNINKNKGLNIAAILARLAQGYDQSIGGTGAIGSAIGDISQQAILSGQQKGAQKSSVSDASFTAKGVKGLTSRTTKEGPNGERTVTEVINDHDQLAGGSPAPPSNVGQAFSGGNTLRPFEQPADLSGLSVENQFKLAQMQEDPITNTITGEDGKQYGMTASGNLIPLGVGTMTKAVKAVPPVRGVTQTEVIDGVPMSFLQDPTTGGRIGDSFKAVPKQVAGAGKDPATDAKLPLQLEQMRLNLSTGIADDGKKYTKAQYDAGIKAYNQSAKRAKLPTRLKRVIVPAIATGRNFPFVGAGAEDFQESDLVMSLPIDNKGKITNATYAQIRTALIRDKNMDEAKADERTALFYATHDLFGEKAKKQYSKKYKSVANVYKKKKK